ncbi:MAG: nuclear transport factor 2 family protein [Alphaproteobacteria bacterium]|nr:nuclear transport factor 2 family protein [Alphaproteobacteria bacterium]
MAMRRNILACAVALTAIGPAFGEGPKAAVGMEADCARLAVDYAYHRDRFDPDGVAGVFAPDGVLKLFGETFTGRAAIAARIGSMGRTTIRHLVSNVRVTPESDSAASMTSYVEVVQAPAGPLPATHPGASTIGEYRDRCVATPEGWRLASRELIIAFALVRP